MTTKQVFKEVTSQFKWYASRSEQWAFSFKRRFAKGQVKLSTIASLFYEHGYSMQDIEWDKTHNWVTVIKEMKRHGK